MKKITITRNFFIILFGMLSVLNLFGQFSLQYFINDNCPNKYKLATKSLIITFLSIILLISFSLFSAIMKYNEFLVYIPLFIIITIYLIIFIFIFLLKYDKINIKDIK